MNNNPKDYIKRIIQTEGDYVNHPSDKGGPTKYGITHITAKNFGYDEDIKNLTKEQAERIYEEMYWYGPSFDLINKVSPIIAYELFDSGVNFGYHRPIIWLQQWLNGFNRQEKDYNDIIITGRIDQNTIEALKAFLNKRKPNGEQVMIAALNCSQGAKYLDLAEMRSANEDFLYGWIAQRVVNNK
jgi:lysozyme family protein